MPHARARPAYVYGADVLRFAAAILVAFFHLTWQHKSVGVLAWYGWIGVQVFFVISGFVIARSANSTTPIRFVESRFLRLYPAAWICAGVNFLCIIVFIKGPANLNPGLFFGLGASLVLYPTGPFLASAYWTLPVEISFYLLVFCILLMGRFRQIERVAHVLCLVSSVYIVAYSAYRAGLVDLPWLEFDYGWKNISLLRHGVYFSFGIYVWLWSAGLLSRLGVAAWIVCALVAPWEITCRLAELIPLAAARLDCTTIWPVPIGIWLASCGLLMASATWSTAIARLPPGLLWLVRVGGLATYPLYLIHESFGGLMADALVHRGCPYFASACIAVVLSGGVAIMIAQVAEPALRNRLRALLRMAGTQGLFRGRLQSLRQPGGAL
jgi:peptidoglycan/LPS O-acetylase OafA/YrhL